MSDIIAHFIPLFHPDSKYQNICLQSLIFRVCRLETAAAACCTIRYYIITTKLNCERLRGRPKKKKKHIIKDKYREREFCLCVRLCLDFFFLADGHSCITNVINDKKKKTHIQLRHTERLLCAQDKKKNIVYQDFEGEVCSRIWAD